MSVNWPTTLPKEFQQNSYSEGNINNLIRTKMNNGPDKRRRKTTLAYQSLKGAMILTEAQRDIFIDFYKEEAVFGAIPVIMPKPGTIDGTMEAFIDSQVITPINGKLWSVSMSLTVQVSA